MSGKDLQVILHTLHSIKDSQVSFEEVGHGELNGSYRDEWTALMFIGYYVDNTNTEKHETYLVR